MTTTPTSGAADLPEALYADAVKFAKERASISYVQRKCRCSYNKAERMLEQMVADGIIQTYNGRKDAALTAQAISQPGGFDAGDMASAAAQGYRDGWTAAQAISAEPAAHVQNPAENEHVADDMSKNGAESNMTQQPVPADSVLEDAARWQMVVLVGNEVMLHPEKRSYAAAVAAYMDAVHRGLDLTGAIDSARKQGGA